MYPMTPNLLLRALAMCLVQGLVSDRHSVEVY